MAVTQKQKSKPANPISPRKVKKPSYKSFRLSKKIRYDAPPLPKARKLFSATVRHLLRHKRLYVGLALVHFVLMLLLVKGLSFGFDSQLSEIKDALEEVFVDESAWLTSAALFGTLLGSAGTATGEAASTYQAMLLVLTSLAVIWALRQSHAGEKVRAKDAFYKGMYPLVQFILVLLVLLLQLLPLAIGNLLYSIVLQNGLAVTGVEQAVWAILFGLLALLSLYMITSSIFALYIVTLPDVKPLQALRSARALVRHRRLMVGRKIAFLPFVLLLIAAAVMLPIILWVTAVAEFVFFVLTVLAVLVTHAYMYELYRKLL